MHWIISNGTEYVSFVTMPLRKIEISVFSSRNQGPIGLKFEFRCASYIEVS